MEGITASLYSLLGNELGTIMWTKMLKSQIPMNRIVMILCQKNAVFFVQRLTSHPTIGYPRDEVLQESNLRGHSFRDDSIASLNLED